MTLIVWGFALLAALLHVVVFAWEALLFQRPGVHHLVHGCFDRLRWVDRRFPCQQGSGHLSSRSDSALFLCPGTCPPRGRRHDHVASTILDCWSMAQLTE